MGVLSTRLGRLATMGLVLGFTLLGKAGSAEAGFQLMLSDGTSSTTISDGGIGDLTGPVADGSIIYTNSSLFGGEFKINVVTGASNQTTGGPPPADIQLTSLTITNTSGSGKTLTITLGDTGFTFPSPGPASLSSTVGGTFLSSTSGDTVSFQSYQDSSDTQFGMANTTGLQGPFVSNGVANVAFGGGLFDKATGITLSSSYSLTSVIAITLTAGGQANVSGTTAVSSVPEPSTMVTLAAGLPFLTLALRRRKASK